MNKDDKLKKSILYLLLLCIGTLFMCVGYAAVQDVTLNITGSVSAVPLSDVHISSVTFSSDLEGESANCSNSFSNLVLNSNIQLSSSNTNSFVEYNVTIENTSSTDYCYNGVNVDSNFWSNNDITYEVTGVNIGDTIPAQSSITFKIKFKYASTVTSITNNTLTSTISFSKGSIFTVTYDGVSISSPTTVNAGSTLTVNLGTGYTNIIITIGGTEFYNYNYVDGILTIDGQYITGNVVIKPIIDTGTVTASLSPSSIDLTTEEKKAVTITVTNTYQYTDFPFTLSISNSDLSLVDVSGNTLDSFTISKNSTNTYTVYVKRNANMYENSSATAQIKLINNSSTLANAGTLNVTMPTDTTPPTINDITLAMTASSGAMTVNWSGSDDVASSITYTINLYNGSGTLLKTYTQTSTSTNTISMELSGVTATAGTQYYVKIYGSDGKNSGESALNSATTTSTNCRKSNTVVRYSVSYDLTSGEEDVSSSNTSSYVLGGAQYTTTLSAQNSGSIDSTSVTVTMGGTTIISDGESSNTSVATYSNKVITIVSVTGNLTIKATASDGGCLVEGTLITLADGTTKKIEDIGYDDLLLVWDFEHGKFTYEYPIWIEKEGKSKIYQKTTFSDGSILNTVDYHGIYNSDLNKFVSVDDKNEFYVGTNVIKKVENQNGYEFKEVQVEKIEKINEEVKYYQIVTTTYYNIMANDFMVTDGNVILVNLYEFNDDYTWKKDRQEIIKDKSNLFSYGLLKNVMPYYMFYGLRASEVKYISNLGYFTLDMLPELMKKLDGYNKNILKEPIKNEFGNNVWMVTTSEDDVKCKDEYLIEEGAYYVIPEVSGKIATWYNTVDGKYYRSNDEIQIWCGTHLIKVQH